MAPVIFPLDASGNLASQMLSNISNRRISLFPTPDAPHPVAAQAVVMRRLEAAVGTFLNTFEGAVPPIKMAEATGGPGKILTDQFREVIYRQAEVFDFYNKTFLQALGDKLPRKLKDEMKIFKAMIHRRRDHISHICNKLKHNSNDIVPVNLNYVPFGPFVFGFGIISHQDDMWAPNKEIHPQRKALSYVCELHQLAADILTCDSAAGRLLGLIQEDEKIAPIHLPNELFLPFGASFRRIAAFSPVGMEESRIQETISCTADAVMVERRTLAIPLRSSAQLQVQFQGDGFTKKLEVF